MKKKLLMMLLTGVLALSVLAGCQGNDSSSNGDSAQEDTQDDTDDQDSQDDMDDQDQAEDQDTQDEASDFAIERCVIADGRYVNNSIHLAFPVTEDMRALTDQEILESVGTAFDIIGESGVYTAEAIENATQGTIYDAMVYLPDMASNVIVCCENLDTTAPGQELTASDYANIISDQMPQIHEDFQAQELQTIELDGEEYIRMDTVVQSISQIYLMKKEGNYMISLIISVSPGSEQAVEDFINSFTAQ